MPVIMVVGLFNHEESEVWEDLEAVHDRVELRFVRQSERLPAVKCDHVILLRADGVQLQDAVERYGSFNIYEAKSTDALVRRVLQLLRRRKPLLPA